MKLVNVVASGAALLLPLSACGDDTDTPSIDRSAEIKKLVEEQTAYNTQLEVTRSNLASYLGSLPVDCSVAISEFRIGGVFAAESDESAREATAEWCGPYYLGAVAIVRELDSEISSMNNRLEQIEDSIAANLAALGVPPATTVG